MRRIISHLHLGRLNWTRNWAGFKKMKEWSHSRRSLPTYEEWEIVLRGPFYLLRQRCGNIIHLRPSRFRGRWRESETVKHILLMVLFPPQFCPFPYPQNPFLHLLLPLPLLLGLVSSPQTSGYRPRPIASPLALQNPVKPLLPGSRIERGNRGPYSMLLMCPHVP